MKAPFSYVVLRYMHDVFTREFVNVAVLVHVPESGFLRLRRVHPLTRVKKFFPGAQSGPLGRMLQFLESRCKAMETKHKSELPDRAISAAEIAPCLLPTDDSALQWSDTGGGLTEDPEQTLQDLFDRLVARHEKAQPVVRKEDDDVWKPFEREFRSRDVLHRFQEKVLHVGELYCTFKNTWQPRDSYLRVFQPLSFDLVDTSDIVEKAVDWGGMVRQLRKVDSEFEINLLLGRPNDQSKWTAFAQAQEVLTEDVTGRKRLVLEERAPEFARQVAEEIQANAE